MKNKPHSQHTFLLVYAGIFLLNYLLTSLIVCLFSNSTYFTVLTAQYQIYLVFFWYWWPPLWVLVGMDEHNKEIKAQLNKIDGYEEDY